MGTTKLLYGDAVDVQLTDDGTLDLGSGNGYGGKRND